MSAQHGGCLRLLSLVLLVGVASCTELPQTSGPIPSVELGGTSSTIDRSQPLVPAVSNQAGGCFWPFVNLWSGDLIVVYPVLQVPAIGPDWDLNFYYNSLLHSETTTLGPGWRHSYEIALLIGVPDPSSITARWGDGRADVFVFDGNDWVGAPALHGRRIVLVGGSYELRTKHGFVYVFDLQGKLLALRDRNGNAMTFAYDGSDRLATMTDATGRTCQWSYDGQGRLLVVGGLGKPALATCEYQGAVLARVRDRAGNPCEFGYNGQEILITANDPDADGIGVDYDPALATVVTRVMTTDGAERRFDYDQPTLQTTVTDVISLGVESVATYALSSSATCIGVTDGPLGTTANSYDAANNLVAHTDADGHTTTMAYSAEGDLTSRTDATGVTVTFAYDPTYHLLVSLLDQAGNAWNGQRDGNGNLTRWTNPLGHQDIFAYDAQGLMTNHTDRRGNMTIYAYDALGNRVSVTDAAGFTVAAIYNLRGVPESLTDQEGNTTAILLTARDEIAEVALPNGRNYRLVWTAGRMLASVEDPRGAVVSWQYNDRKQVVRMIDALGFPFDLVRNGAGWMIQARNALGNTTQYDRDLAGRLVSIVDPDGGVRSFGLGCCDVLSRTDAHGTMNYQYSPRHELVQALSGDGTLAISYGWDARGLQIAANLTAPPDPPIGYTFAYDAAGRRTSSTAIHLANRVTTFVRDPEANVVQVVSNQNPAPVSYVYNNRNLCQRVTAGSPPLSANVTYTPRRQVDQIAYTNGVLAIHGYSANGELLTVHYQGLGFVADYNASYDPSGNRVLVHGNLPPPIGPRDLMVDYDPRSQPVTVNELPGPGLQSILYNPVRDRSHKTGPGGPVPYGYTAAQRMIVAGPTNLQWDAAGGATQVMSPGVITTFAYRADGALKQMVQNGQVYQVKVGPLGEVARVVLPGGSSRWYALDATGGGLLRREIALVPGGQPQDGFVFVPGLESRAVAPSPLGVSSAPAIWLKSPAIVANRRPTLPDPWGSIAIVADGNGNLLHSRVYGLFGDVLAQHNPQQVAQGFLGMDVEEGLSAPVLLGISAGNAGVSGHDALSAGVASVRPYLSETGSFLYDSSFGPDGLFCSFTSASICNDPFCTGCKHHPAVPWPGNILLGIARDLYQFWQDFTAPQAPVLPPLTFEFSDLPWSTGPSPSAPLPGMGGENFVPGIGADVNRNADPDECDGPQLPPDLPDFGPPREIPGRGLWVPGLGWCM